MWATIITAAVTLITLTVKGVISLKEKATIDICGQRPLNPGKRADEWRECRKTVNEQKIQLIGDEINEIKDEKTQNKKVVMWSLIIGSVIIITSITIFIVRKVRK